MKDKIIIIICAILISIAPYAQSQTRENETPDTKVSIRIKWNEVRNAVRYRALIRDSSGKLIIDRNTDSNSIELDINPGEYGMRIGAVNKFSKIGSWSDWAAFSVKAPEKPVEEPEPEEPEEKEKPEKIFTTFKIGAGASYFYLLPKFNENLNNSYMSGNLLLGYSPAKLIPLALT